MCCISLIERGGLSATAVLVLLAASASVAWADSSDGVPVNDPGKVVDENVVHPDHFCWQCCRLCEEVSPGVWACSWVVVGPKRFPGDEPCPPGWVGWPDPARCEGSREPSPSFASPEAAYASELARELNDPELDDQGQRDVLIDMCHLLVSPTDPAEIQGVLLKGIAQYLERDVVENYAVLDDVVEEVFAEKKEESSDEDCLCWTDCNCSFEPGLPPACSCYQVCPPDC